MNPDTETANTLEKLHDLAHYLGDPVRDCAILAEGNVSAAVGADKATFWLKASGSSLCSMRPDEFVLMNTERALSICDHDYLDDAGITRVLTEAKADVDSPHRPSTEAGLHAACLVDGEAGAVGHTHPVPFLSILCSANAEAALAGRLFPDEIVVCGPAPCLVGYHDPGPPLARASRDAIRAYKAHWGVPPKVVLLRNHGLFALGKDVEEVKRVTAMATKVARALIGTFALGGPRFLTEEAANRIYTRPDELYRQNKLDILRVK